MKIAIIAICLTLTTFSFAQSKLVNYFNLLPKEHQHGYTISKKGKTYVADAGTGAVQVVVDDANGFLEIKDSGTGGGTFVFQLAIFKNAKKEDLIGVNYFSYEDLNQGMITGGNLFFFGGEKKLSDVTKDVLPDMTTAEDKAYNGHSDVIFETYKEGVYEYFELPRNGTTVQFHFGSNSLNQACANNDEQACSIQKSLVIVDLYWHKDPGYLNLTK